MKFIIDGELPTLGMNTEGFAVNADEAVSAKRSEKSSHLNLQCRITARNNENLDTSEIKSYNLPSFKTDVYGHVYHCIHCNKTYYDCRTIKDHLGAVHRDFQYYCQYCGEFFSIYWQLKRHQNRYTYNCGYCDYSSNHYSQFREHNRRAHKIAMKPKFRSENRFNKAYECDICGYQVLRPHMYKKHMKTVHKQDVE